MVCIASLISHILSIKLSLGHRVGLIGENAHVTKTNSNSVYVELVNYLFHSFVKLQGHMTFELVIVWHSFMQW